MLAVLFLVLFFIGDTEPTTTGAEPPRTSRRRPAPGSFPVPPMPEGGAVRGPARPLSFGSPTRSETRESPTMHRTSAAGEEI